VKKWRSWITFVLNLVAVVVAVAVLVVGFRLLVIDLRGAPVGAAFTRVGGATRVETALDASRFWLAPPQLVVETQADASQQIMLGAAQCAMAHDAPLLFTSPDPQRQRLVDATINDWRKIETPKGRALPELITIQSQRDVWRAIESTIPELITIQNLPELITIQSQRDVTPCLANGDSADGDGLSTLEVSNPILRLPQVPVRQTLASVVVFAAGIQPGDPPDVAVSLALAAHMARANREDVSLVVVPHYLESDLELENKLQRQHELVTGGVVLGQTPTVPDDTRVLLRHLLTSTDRQGFLGQLQANLGAVGPLVAALLALVGVGAVVLAAPAIIASGTSGIREVLAGQPPVGPDPGRVPPPEPPIQRLVRELRRLWRYLVKIFRRTRCTPKGPEWLNAAATKNDLKQEVTVSLRSGWTVTGKVQDPSNVAVWRINEAKLGQSGSQIEKARYVLVPVVDIELIRVNIPPQTS
jgi:hypothetical protein